MPHLAEPVFLPAGRRFAPSELVFYARAQERTLAEAIAEADLLVSTPHSGSLIPAELAEFLQPGLSPRLQFDFTDMSTSAVARAWAARDPRVIVVENPHPRLVRDPNRERPADLAATLREAFARVRAAGPVNKVDLSGVDAVRPVMFNFMPLLREPADDDGFARMARAFQAAASQGLDVYERTRDDLLEQLVEAKLRAARDSGQSRTLIALSLHDTMNHTARPDGAVAVERAPADRLPDLVALSNRGDAEGEPRGTEPVTMHPALIRALADAHRSGFAVADSAQVQLNQPYLGSREITAYGARFRELADEAAAAGLTLGAVQAEFLREYLLGEEPAAALMQPGTDWPTVPSWWTDQIAAALHASWDAFRSAATPLVARGAV
jgi:hypothetical protein